MSARATGYFYCGLAMVTVGSTVAASKLIADGMPPFTATALRFAIAFPVLCALMYLTRTPWPRPGRGDRMLLLIQAGSGSVGYTVLLIAGMSLASAVDAGVIAGTLPAVAALLALLVLKERPDRTVVAAIALASAGILFVTLPFKGASGGPAPAALLGHALVLGAITCEAVFILLHKKLRVPIAPLPLSTVMTGIGFVLAAGPAVLEQPWTMSPGAASVAGVVYYALVPTVGGFLLWYAGSMRVSAGEASLLTALAPVSAVALAAAVLREPIGTNQLIGMLLVTSAVLLSAARAGLRNGRPKPSEAGSASALDRLATRT